MLSIICVTLYLRTNMEIDLLILNYYVFHYYVYQNSCMHLHRTTAMYYYKFSST